MKTEILYGIHPVSEALTAARRHIHRLYLATGKNSRRLEPVVKLAESRRIEIRSLAPGRLEALAGTRRHQGVAARVSPYPWADFKAIWSTPPPAGGRRFFLLLDGVVDPQNLGALVRTALGVGVEAVVVPRHRCTPPTPAASKASAGALEHMRLCAVTNLAHTLADLKRGQVWAYGLDAAADSPLYACDLTGSLALVIGGEEKGLRPLVKKQCDELIAIPQRGPVSSLNASAAGAVVMYEAFRQRLDHG